MFEGANSVNGTAMRFIVDQPGNNGLNYSLGAGDSGKTAAIDNKTVAQFSGGGHFYPGADSTYDLGLNGTRWRNFYADTLYGDGSNLTGISAGTSLSGSTNNTVCTVTGANAIQGESNVQIDSSGRLLIGTTTEGQGNADELTISFNNTGVSGGDQGRCGMTIRSGDNTSGVTQNGYIYFSDGTSGANESKGVVAYEHSNDAMYFSTDQVARLRIDSSGRVLIGTSTEGHENANTLTLSNSGTAGMTIRSTSSNCHIYFSDATSGAGEYVGQLGYNHGSDYMFFHTGGSERFRANSSGITVTGTVDSASDVILKENIKTIDNALDKVTKLRGVEYDYKDNKKHSIGVIAQEVEEVLPELVNGSEQKSVAYGNIAAVLIEAIKEQNEVINKMKKEIEDLKG